jgi:hypothetical protein
MINKQVYFLRACMLLAAAALSACSAPVKKDDGAAVEARATERWNYLIAHQAEKAYDYLSPGYRQTITREKYATQRNDVAMRWKSVQVAGHACEADTCTVNLWVESIVPMQGIAPQPIKTPLEEHWIKVDRTWYYVPDNRLKATPVTPAEGQPASVEDASKHPV